MAITQCSCLFSPSSPFNLTTLIAKTCEDQAKHRTLLLFIRVRNLTNAASTYAKTANVDEIHLLFGTCIGAPQQVTGPPGVDSVWHGMASCSAHGTVGQLDPQGIHSMGSHTLGKPRHPGLKSRRLLDTTIPSRP